MILRTLLSLTFCLLALTTSLLTFQVVGSILSAMLVGSVVYAGLELATISLRI